MITTKVRQRTDADCGAAALAILLIDLIMRDIDPKMRGLNGLLNRELLAAAQRMHLPLAQTRSFDLDTDSGILRVRWKSGRRKKDSPYGHYVTVIDGAIHCPAEQAVLPWREYLVRFDAAPTTLLRLEMQ